MPGKESQEAPTRIEIRSALRRGLPIETVLGPDAPDTILFQGNPGFKVYFYKATDYIRWNAFPPRELPEHNHNPIRTFHPQASARI